MDRDNRGSRDQGDQGRQSNNQRDSEARISDEAENRDDQFDENDEGYEINYPEENELDENKEAIDGIKYMFNELPVPLQGICLKSLTRLYAHNFIDQGKREIVSTFEEALNDSIFQGRKNADKITSMMGEDPEKHLSQRTSSRHNGQQKRSGNGNKKLKDYIVEALEAHGGEMSIAEIREAVFAAGYQSSSENPHSLIAKYCSVLQGEKVIKGHNNGRYSALSKRAHASAQ